MLLEMAPAQSAYVMFNNIPRVGDAKRFKLLCEGAARSADVPRPRADEEIAFESSPVLEQRILGRARFSGRADDNVEAMKLRFDTFKSETLPTVELFKGKGKCVEIDTSKDRETVYSLLREQLAAHTDPLLMAQPLSETAEVLLGLRPYPKGD